MCTRVDRPSWARSRQARADLEGVGVSTKAKDNPMQSPSPMHLSPRCGAKTRSQSPCRAPAMPNGRCRMHGGASPGAPKGKANGNYKHGQFTLKAIESRRTLNALIKRLKEAAEQV